MRTTVTIDDELLKDAKDFSGIENTSDVLREALKRMVQREAARRLAAIGGTEPDFVAPPRRRFPPE